MLGTYLAVLLIVAASLLVGQALLVACGWRRWSWLAPAPGLALLTPLAWGTVQLPGEGMTALGAVLLAAAVSLAYLRGRVERIGEAARRGGAPALAALLLASIPFVAEGHFGILGTGFNVDMSQHLFTADWLSHPRGEPEPSLVEQGYPLGPHALAVAAAELPGGDLVTGFGGLTIAIPVLAALASLAVLERLAVIPRVAASSLVALPYMVASFLAQGSFKELFEAFYVLAFALGLYAMARGEPRDALARSRLARAVPLGAIAAGSVYAYSAPGLAWLVGGAVLWELAELWVRRGGIRLVRAALAPTALAVIAFAVLTVPDVPRVVDFGSSAANVADAGDEEPAAPRGGGPLEGEREDRKTRTGAGADGEREEGGRFNDDLGNLFDEISPLEALGIWPSGDFRVEPGDGAAPAALFYAGILLGALALGVGLVRWLRAGDLAVPAALATAAAILAGAAVLSTPYAAAKAVVMISPLAALVAIGGLLLPVALDRTTAGADRPRPAPGRIPLALGIAAAFALAAGGSSLLALGNAPVGPREYSPGLAKLRERFKGDPTLVLVSGKALAERHARDYFAWEARGAAPLCIEPRSPGAEGTLPGIRYVITSGGGENPPFPGLALVERKDRFRLWEVRAWRPRGGPLIDSGPPDRPTVCEGEFRD